MIQDLFTDLHIVFQYHIILVSFNLKLSPKNFFPGHFWTIHIYQISLSLGLLDSYFRFNLHIFDRFITELIVVFLIIYHEVHDDAVNSVNMHPLVKNGIYLVSPL